MKVLIATTFALALLASSSASSEEWVKIGDMRKACTEVIAGASGKLNPDQFETGLCFGFVLGQAAWRDSACRLAKGNTHRGSFETVYSRDTQGHSLVALAQALVNWTDDHPELWSRKLIFTAVQKDFWSEFPCVGVN